MKTLSIIAFFIIAVALITVISNINNSYASENKKQEQIYIDWDGTYSMDNYILRKEIR